MERGWTQAHLGSLANMRQSVICRCESMGYDQFTLSTLKALAVAFDVGLKVEFVPFSELVHNAANPQIYGLDVPSYVQDAQLGRSMGASISIEHPEYDELGSTPGEKFESSQELTTAPVIQTSAFAEALNG